MVWRLSTNFRITEVWGCPICSNIRPSTYHSLNITLFLTKISCDSFERQLESDFGTTSERCVQQSGVGGNIRYKRKVVWRLSTNFRITEVWGCPICSNIRPSTYHSLNITLFLTKISCDSFERQLESDFGTTSERCVQQSGVGGNIRYKRGNIRWRVPDLKDILLTSVPATWWAWFEILHSDDRSVRSWQLHLRLSCLQ